MWADLRVERLETRLRELALHSRELELTRLSAAIIEYPLRDAEDRGVDEQRDVEPYRCPDGALLHEHREAAESARARPVHEHDEHVGREREERRRDQVNGGVRRPPLAREREPNSEGDDRQRDGDPWIDLPQRGPYRRSERHGLVTHDVGSECGLGSPQYANEEPERTYAGYYPRSDAQLHRSTPLDVAEASARATGSVVTSGKGTAWTGWAWCYSH